MCGIEYIMVDIVHYSICIIMATIMTISFSLLVVCILLLISNKLPAKIVLTLTVNSKVLPNTRNAGNGGLDFLIAIEN